MNDRTVETDPEARKTVIENAITNASKRYILERNKKINGFVKRHYSFRGTLKIHSHAIGLDIIRVPINIIWSVINIILALLGFAARAFGADRLHRLIKKIPAGLETDMDKQINWLILTELLQLPHQQGDRHSSKDALMDEITRDPDLQHLIEVELESLDQVNDYPAFKQEIERKLAEYGSTRTGASELASNTVLLVTSKLAFGKVFFGALSAGVALSVSAAQSIAASNFWLGSTIGSYYYAIMPVEASWQLIVAMTALVAIALALASTFIGIITDPVQSKLGFHQRRLRKLVSAVEKDLISNSEGEFHLREKYCARVFDIVGVLDALRRSI